MNGRYLLDTNIAIALFAGDPSVEEHLGEAEEEFISGVVLGELYYGAAQSVRMEENVARIDGLVAGATVLGCDAGTARSYGTIKNRLRAKGRPIPENDIWIAATTQQYGLTVVSRDEHFGEVEVLTIKAW